MSHPIMPHHVSKARFGELVEKALRELPEPFATHLEQISIEIKTRPSRKQLRDLGLEDDELLFGLYQGHPLQEHGPLGAAVALPARITIFQEDIELVCEDETQLVREIRTTVLHEVGHHFGMDEDDLEKLGYQ